MEKKLEKILRESYFNGVKDLIKLVIKPDYQEEFVRFIETGEASKEFLEYLRQDSQAQEAVDKVFKKQSKAFEDFARKLYPLKKKVK